MRDGNVQAAYEGWRVLIGELGAVGDPRLWSTGLARRHESVPGQHAGVLTAPGLLYRFDAPRPMMRSVGRMLWCTDAGSSGVGTEQILALGATDLRDGGPALGGMGVLNAVSHVNGEIAACLVGRNAERQAEIDDALIALDGTTDKSRLGGNAMIATSMAMLHAVAGAHRTPLWKHLAQGSEVTLPLPEIQIFGGGVHAGRRVDIQDFMVMALGAQTFSEALTMTAAFWPAITMPGTMTPSSSSIPAASSPVAVAVGWPLVSLSTLAPMCRPLVRMCRAPSSAKSVP